MFLPSPEPTDEMKSHQTRLYWVCGAYLVLGLLKLFGSVGFAVNEVICSLFFLIGILSTSHCLVIFFMIMVLFTMANYIMFFALIVQRHIYVGESPIFQTWQFFTFFLVTLISFIFDFFVLNTCLDAYKCFKWETIKGFIDPPKPGTKDPEDTRSVKAS